MILSSHGIIASQITQFVGLLDVYSGAAAAYSLRKLRTAYTGSAIEVRRTNNDVANIGFTSTGELDTTALLAFTGTGALDNGFVTKWYDQSGNGRDATQTTALNQPQIVSSGSVILENGKPSVQFDGTNDFLESVVNYTITAQSSFATFKYLNGLTLNVSARVVTQGGIGNDFDAGNYIPIIRSSTTEAIASFQGAFVAAINASYNTQILFSSIHSGSEITNTLNSTTQNNFSVSHNKTYTKLALGGTTSSTTGARYLLGNVQEAVIYNLDQSSNRTGIEDNINDFYSIY
jgi:hypothetical protein